MSKLPDANTQLRIQLEQFASKMARQVIGPVMPPGIGFAFIAFDFGEGGNIAYCSSGERESTATALRMLLDKWDKERTEETQK